MSQNDQQLINELLDTFREEAAEYLEIMNQNLLRLERQPDEPEKTELLQEAFRVAHSLKGAARAVSINDVEHLAHEIEDVLKQARDNKIELTPDRCDVLYTKLDNIQAVLQEKDLSKAPVSKSNHNESQSKKTNSSETTISSDESSPNGAGSMSLVHDSDNSIRVSVNKLDSLMAQTGQLAAARLNAEQRASELQNLRHRVEQFPRIRQEIQTLITRLDRTDPTVIRLHNLLDDHQHSLQDVTEQVNNVDAALKRDLLELGMITDSLNNEMRRVRMLPFQVLNAILERSVRDVARTEDKQVEFIIQGNAVELDKKVLENLKDPLLHILRNSVSHGIESLKEREKSGKPAAGTITLRVIQRGNEAHIHVSDDGRGFDLDKIRKAAAKERQVDPEEVPDDEAISLAFLPGVSTSETVTEISGRGVGLDVVRKRIEAMQGQIQIDNHPGHGVTIHLTVPVSLAMTRVLLVGAGGERLALPLQTVEKIFMPEHLYTVQGQTMITVDDKPIPVASLAEILGLPNTDTEISLTIIMSVGEQQIAILVDDVLTEQEIAVKPFGNPVINVRHLAGAALLGNGEPVIVLNTADLVRTARGIKSSAVRISAKPDEQEEHIAEHLLIVDDSITTRTLEKNILEAAGYRITTATDGKEALEYLKREKDIVLMVADVEMPNMDGITLTKTLRERPEYQELPIILVTSLETPEDRERGMVAGANAYIAKRGFNQAELLATIENLIPSYTMAVV